MTNGSGRWTSRFGGFGRIGGQRLRASRRPLLQMMSGVLLLLAIAWGPGLYGRLTAGERLDPNLAHTAGPVNVEVTMGFTPQGFHLQALQQQGVFAGRIGEHTVRLFNVSPASLRTLSGMYWISSIRPAQPR